MAQNGLLDFLQGASNAAASNVSAPVDGIAWLLRKAGIPVPEAPIGGSDWMAKKGLTAKPQNYLAGLLGESVGGVAPIVAAAKAPQIAKGLLAGQEAGKRGAYAVAEKGNDMAQGYMQRSGMMPSMMLYHGTNDSRPLTRIDPNKGEFGGLFASARKGGALSHGDNLYRFTIPDEAVLTQRAIDYELPPSAVRNALSKVASGKGSAEVRRLVESGEDVWNHADEAKILAALKVDDLGAASWELQRLRGQFAKNLGFKAVEMPDEHGISYLILGDAVKPRPANEAAKYLARNGLLGP